MATDNQPKQRVHLTLSSDVLDSIERDARAATRSLSQQIEHVYGRLATGADRMRELEGIAAARPASSSPLENEEPNSTMNDRNFKSDSPGHAGLADLERHAQRNLNRSLGGAEKIGINVDSPLVVQRKPGAGAPSNAREGTSVRSPWSSGK